MLPVAHYNDPSPSRLRYRFERLWLKPSFRRIFRLWLPLAALCVAGWMIWSNPELNAYVDEKISQTRMAIAARPELQVNSVSFREVTPELQSQIMTLTGLDFPVSSLDLDVMKIKTLIEQLDAVKSAEVIIQSGGVLEISASERMPVMLWRDVDILRLLDVDGLRVAEVTNRAAFSELPLVVGSGADLAITEALKIFNNTGASSDRVRGLVRVGERRWDVVLDRGQTIMLPETGAITALRKVLEFHNKQDLLNRDVILIDMRNPDRLVLRLSDTAVSELRRLRAVVRGEDV